jgi:hypothetical protein
VNRLARLFCLMAAVPFAHAAVCNPNDFQGSYGFQLSGATTISGYPQPAASTGHLVLDGSGAVSGVSSVMIAGLLLGNPVMGMYQAKTDCSLSWSLQDDSGNWQHFQGTMSEDGRRITFRQSDPGGPSDGIMMRSAPSCTAVDFQGRYSLNVSGNNVDVDTRQVSDHFTVSGLIEADGQGNLLYSPRPATPFQPAGTYEMEDDCIVQIEVELPSDGYTTGWHFRAILVNGGHDALGIESDPGTVATLRLVLK